MSKVLNRRNAVLGWITWTGLKYFAKTKAREAVPAVEGGRPNRSAIATVVAALSGAALFWRKRRRPAQA
jgi:hypothetical protein